MPSKKLYIHDVSPVKQRTIQLQNNSQNARHSAVNLFEMRIAKLDLAFLVFLYFENILFHT